MKRFKIYLYVTLLIAPCLYAGEGPVLEEGSSEHTTATTEGSFEEEYDEERIAAEHEAAAKNPGEFEDTGLQGRQAEQGSTSVREAEGSSAKDGGFTFSEIREQREGQADLEKGARAYVEAAKYVDHLDSMLSSFVEEHDRRVDAFDGNVESIKQLDKDIDNLQSKLEGVNDKLDTARSSIARSVGLEPDIDPDEFDAAFDQVEEELKRFKNHVEQYGVEGAKQIYKRSWGAHDFGSPEVRPILERLGISDPADMTLEKVEQAEKAIQKKFKKFNEFANQQADLIQQIDVKSYEQAQKQSDNNNVTQRSAVFEDYRKLLTRVNQVKAEMESLATDVSADTRAMKEKRLHKLLDKVESLSQDMSTKEHARWVSEYDAPEQGELSRSMLQKIKDWIADAKFKLFGDGKHPAEHDGSAARRAQFDAGDFED